MLYSCPPEAATPNPFVPVGFQTHVLFALLTLHFVSQVLWGPNPLDMDMAQLLNDKADDLLWMVRATVNADRTTSFPPT